MLSLDRGRIRGLRQLLPCWSIGVLIGEFTQALVLIMIIAGCPSEAEALPDHYIALADVD